MTAPAIYPVSGGLAQGLPPRLATRLAAAGTIIAYRSGATIHQRGDDKPGLSVIVEGAVSFSVTDIHGERINLARFGPGDCFGEFTLFAGLPRTHDATAVGPTRVNQIGKAAFFRLLDDEPAFRDHLLRRLATMLALSTELLDDERRLSLKARLAKFLAARAPGDAPAYEVVITQTDLAELFAASRVAVGAALRDLNSIGLIETAYGAVRVINRAALGDWLAKETGVEPLFVAR